jgi:uncharacterized protein YggE
MKGYLIITFFFWTAFLFSQGEVGNITITGNSSIQVAPYGIKIDLIISDLPPNEYRKTRYKKLTESQAEFINNLKVAGVNAELTRSNQFYSNNYGENVESQYFYIIAKDVNEANNIKKAMVEGVRISSFQYLYKPLPPNIYDQYTSLAVQNAKSKAETLAKMVNKKLGNVISVDYGNDILLSEQSSFLETFNISVTITYSLL